MVPERLVGAFEAARSFIDRHPPTLDQAIVAEFMLDGHFGHHVRRMRQVYAERLLALREAAKKHLGGLVDVVEAVAGMRTIGWIKTGVADSVVAQRARSLGLELTALSEFTLRHSQPPALILGCRMQAQRVTSWRRGPGSRVPEAWIPREQQKVGVSLQSNAFIGS